MSRALASCLLLLSLINLNNAAGISLPLKRTVRKGLRDVIHRRGQATQVGLGDFEDASYSVVLSIGGFETSLVLDTGSSDLWVISSDCNSASCTHTQDSLYPTTSFTPSGSSVDLKYGDSSTGTYATGPIGKDSVAIGGLQLDGQYFAAIDDTTTTVLETNSNGIFGVGFPVISQIFTEVYAGLGGQDVSSSSPPSDNGTRASASSSSDLVSTSTTSTTSIASTTSSISITSSTNSTSITSVSSTSTSTSTVAVKRNLRNHLKKKAQNFATLFFPNFSQVSAGLGSRQVSDQNSSTAASNQNNSTTTTTTTTTSNQTSSDSTNGNGTDTQADQNNASSGTSTVPQILASFLDYGPFVSRLVTASALDKPMFTISLQRDSVDTSDDTNLVSASEVLGSITIGDIPDGVSADSLTWANVRLYPSSQGGLPSPPNSNEEYPLAWEIPIDGVFLDGTRLPDSKLTPGGVAVTALVDSGSSLLRGPPDVLGNLQHILGETFSCATSHSLAFQIGGKMFPVDPRDFAQQANEGSVDQCVLNVVATDTPVVGNGYLYSWSLGDPFLKGVVAAFHYGNLTYPSQDLPKIGFLSTVPNDAANRWTSAVQSAKASGGNLLDATQAAPTGSFTSFDRIATLTAVAGSVTTTASGAPGVSVTHPSGSATPSGSKGADGGAIAGAINGASHFAVGRPSILVLIAVLSLVV